VIATFTVDTAKFRSLLSSALLYDSNVLFESGVLAVLGPDGLDIRDMSLDVVAVAIVASPAFFKKFDCPQETKVIFTPSLFEVIDRRFKKTEEIEVSIDTEKIYVTTVGKGPKYDEPLMQTQKPTFGLKLTNSDYGTITIKTIEKAKVIANVQMAGFTNMPNSREYGLVCSANTLDHLALVSREGGGDAAQTRNFSSPIDTIAGDSPVQKFDDMNVQLDSNYLNRITSNIMDRAWFFADPVGVTFTKTEDNLSVLMILATKAD
jgi:hypothetical protein